MKGNKLKRIIGMGALWALLCTGCFNGLDQPLDGETSAEKGLVRVIIDGTTARTVVPSDPGFRYTLSFTALGKSPVVQNIEGVEGTAYLDVGNWTLAVSGNKAGDTVAESDAIQVSVIQGDGTLTVPVTMHPLTGGANGTFHYAIDLGVLTGTSVTITLNPLSGGGSPITVTATGGDVPLAPGQYLLQVKAERGGRSAYRQEVVHIYSHTATAKEYRFIESNFTDSTQIPQWQNLVWYVSNTGSDSNDGLSSGAALATVGKALELIKGTYAYNIDSGDWPVEADMTPSKAAIVIQGTITADTGTWNGMVEISGTNAYPPLELRGPAAGTGTLDATGKDKQVLYIADGNSVTLGDNLTLTGGSSYYSGGVYVFGGSFTMSGGEISDNTSTSGGGVYVYDGSFTMSGGKISGNTSSGGGVYVYGSSSSFTMTGGEISGNTSYSGGGVYVYDGSFTMSGGEISGNTSSYDGGGVYVESGTFNKQPASGSTTSGIIYGYTAGDSRSNKVVIDNIVQTNKGSAVYCYPGKKQETTAGETVSLSSESDTNWDVSTSYTWSGSWEKNYTNSYTSNSIGHSSSTWETLTITTNTSCSITVRLTASSESGYDYGYASTLDGSPSTGSYQFRVSGSQYSTYTYTVPAGTHYLYFGYVKDGGAAYGDDRVYVEILDS